MGDWYLARELNGIYGWRVFNRRPAVVGGRPSLLAGAAFLTENVIDNGVYLTFSALVPPVRPRAAAPPAAARRLPQRAGRPPVRRVSPRR